MFISVVGQEGISGDYSEQDMDLSTLKKGSLVNLDSNLFTPESNPKKTLESGVYEIIYLGLEPESLIPYMTVRAVKEPEEA